MSIQDLIQTINTQLPDNNNQLITEAILRGVLTDMVNTLNPETRVFNITSSQVTDNVNGTYTITVTDPTTGALAFDETLAIYQYDGANWTMKVDGADAISQAAIQALNDANQYTDDEITALNLGSASQSDVGDFIASTEKGAANGVTPLGADQKVPNQYLPAIAISEVIEATETDIASFAANSASYTFQTGDVIIIDDGSGNLQHYQYKGGVKTDVNEYSLINATQVDWSNVTGKPALLQPGDNAFELNTQFQTLADAPTITWDVSQGEIAKVILGGNRILANPTNLKAGRYDLIVEQDVVGNRALYLDTNYRMPDGELILSSEGIDKVSFISDGTLMYGAINKGYRYVPQGFVMTVDTSQAGTSTNTQFTIPTTGSGYNYTVKDANTGVAYLTGQTGNATVDFGSPGVYAIEIVGDFPGIYFNNGGDKDKLIEIKQWGNIVWTSFSNAFNGCSNLTSASGAPILDAVTDFTNAFRGCSSFTSLDVSNWDMSSVTSLSSAFRGCSSFTSLDVSNWDMSSVTSLYAAFLDCSSFTSLDVSNWDMSNVTDMRYMLSNCTSLPTVECQNWNIESVTNFVDFAINVTIPTATYDQILNNWAAQSVNPGLSVNFGNSKYSPAGQVGRDILINTHGWTITDGGLAP